MRLIYDLGIRMYVLLILAASIFNPKARQWIRGRRGQFRRMEREVDPNQPLTWFHCSSLGEFEQGRPVIEKIRQAEPGTRILLTFYSPSGYEVRKNHPLADHVFYLPLDTRRNARRFLERVRIGKAFFVKYEFWYHFVSRLHAEKTPLYLISGIFRKNQVFFRWYGGWYRRILERFDHLFVQQESSLELLSSTGISHASVSGDTRFDRVYEIAREIKPDGRFLSFCGDSRIIVAGSTWPADEEILIPCLNGSLPGCKWIIAPHEIHEGELEKLAGQIPGKVQRYTRLREPELPDTNVILVDTIGLLSSLYQYAHIAYIGGGFGRGIHNTLEAAAFGKPVIFGPNYHKFQEASDLVSRGAAWPVSGSGDLETALDKLLGDPALLKTSGDAAESYVTSMIGASSRIVDFALKRKTE